MGTLAIGAAGATNAALLAASILATKFPQFVAPLDAWRKKQTDDVADAPSDNATAYGAPVAASAQPVASILSAATRAAPATSSHAQTPAPTSVSIPPPTTTKLVCLNNFYMLFLYLR